MVPPAGGELGGSGDTGWQGGLVAAGNEQRAVLENKGTGSWCESGGTPMGALSLGWVSHGVGVLPPQVRMMSPCCGRGVPHSVLLESPPREGDRSGADRVLGKWGVVNAEVSQHPSCLHPRCARVPTSQSIPRRAAAGLQPLSPLGRSRAGGSVGTHAVQFSTASPKPSSTSRLVATLAKPWGTSSHSSKRTPVPSE